MRTMQRTDRYMMQDGPIILTKAKVNCVRSSEQWKKGMSDTEVVGS